jgi:hypothetical protein
VAFFRLPASGIGVLLREPAGAEDMLLVEADACDTTLAVALLRALARPAEGEAEALDWEALPVTDLDVALLHLRQMVLGDLIRSDMLCQGAATEAPSPSAPGCGRRIDVSFRVSDYLAHHLPETPSGVVPDEGRGWFRLVDADVRFRLPSGADLRWIAGEADAERALAERCIQLGEALSSSGSGDVSEHVQRRVEAAMEALAPSLYSDIDGVCPECGATVRAPFDPQRYVLRELREHASYLYEEVHILASRYHWPEREILALPRLRRARYAELAQAERRAG